LSHTILRLGSLLDCSANVMNLAIPPELGPGPSPDPIVEGLSLDIVKDMQFTI